MSAGDAGESAVARGSDALELVAAVICPLDAAVAACRHLERRHPAREALDDAVIALHDARRALAEPA